MKRRIIIPALLVMIIAVIQIFVLSAYGSNEIIRVGLVTSFEGISSVGVGGGSVMTGYSSDNSFSEIQYLDLGGGGTLSKSYSYYISVEGSFGDYASAKAKSDELTAAGYNSIPAFKGSGVWNVYIGPYDSSERATAATGNYPGAASVCAPSGTTMYLASAVDRMIYDFSGGSFALTGDSYVTIGGKSYRGYIEFCSTEGGFTAVNVIPLETYLCGIVPSEVPSSWGAEALKAQAVAARTYAENKLRSGGETAIYDICDNTHCQMYEGTKNEAASTTAAVNATAGQVATYNGSLINAVYCSSAGGVTDDNVNVWGENVPYLKSVKEIDGAEVVSWSRDYSFSQLSNMLASKGVSIGKLVYVSVTRSDNGRVYTMTFSGEGGSYSIEKEDVRTFFNGTEQGSLQSRVFDISFKNDPSTGEFILHMDGKGWGHGLGLSQYGAMSMANAGYTYDQILKHYYNGIEITGY